MKDVAFFTDHIDSSNNLTSERTCDEEKHARHPDVAMRCYELVTQFNDTVLPARVYERHAGPFGKGPLRRDLWVGEKDQRPVPVLVSDGPAFKGAYHVRLDH